MKKNIKTIIGLIIVFVIGISTTVGAAAIFKSEDITYSSDKTDKTNVKDSLDELYDLTTNYVFYKPLADQVELGDYISMTPTCKSYIIPARLTGYEESQEINPSELNLWRVIRKNEDGTIDVVSEYVSNEKVTFIGKTGYLNYVGVLNQIAAQYTNTKYVQSTRHMGYNGQTEYCSTLDECLGDQGDAMDTNLVRKAVGTLRGRTLDESVENYWISSRNILQDEGSYTSYRGYYWNSSYSFQGGMGIYIWYNSGSESGGGASSVRPILTLKSDVQIKSGDGKSAETAYQLQ